MKYFKIKDLNVLKNFYLNKNLESEEIQYHYVKDNCKIRFIIQILVITSLIIILGGKNKFFSFLSLVYMGYLVYLIYCNLKKIDFSRRKKDIHCRITHLLETNSFITKEKIDGITYIRYTPTIYYKILPNSLVFSIYLDGSKHHEKYRELGDKLSNLFHMRLKDYKEVDNFANYYLTNETIDYIELDNKCYGKRIKGCTTTQMVFNKDLIWDYTKCPHGLINGSTGSGKSYILFYIIRNLYSIGAKLYLIDPKKSDISYLSNIGLNVAETKGEIIKTLRCAVEEMEQRYEEMKNNENYKMGVTYKDLNYKPIFVIIDEYTAFISTLDNKEKKEFESYVTNIVLKGRGAGCFILIAMQRADANILSANLRDNLGLRLVMGSMTEMGYEISLGHEYRSLSLTITDLMGKNTHSGCGFIFIDGVTSSPQEFYAPFMKNYNLVDDLKSFDKPLVEIYEEFI